MTPDEIDVFFTYHRPFGNQSERYEAIRAKARELGQLIDELCPDSPDKTAAIRKLREAVMTANAAIACYETEHDRSANT